MIRGRLRRPVVELPGSLRIKDSIVIAGDDHLSRLHQGEILVPRTIE
jgi:hypothetical protein